MKAKRSIKTTLIIFFIFSVIVMSIAIGGISIFSLKYFSATSIEKYEEAMNEGYQTEIKSQVETAITVLEDEYSRVQDGIMTEEQAQA